MSMNLSALLSANLSREELYCLPKRLEIISKKQNIEGWKWYESDPPNPVRIENFEKLIEDGFLWIDGPFMIVPTRESIEICYTYRYSVFFTNEKSVLKFIEICIDIARILGCNKVYFLTDAQCETMNYKAVETGISNGELTEADESSRLLEYYDHDIYSKSVNLSCNNMWFT